MRFTPSIALPALAALALSAAEPAFGADEPEHIDPVVMRAALMLSTYDQMSAACRKAGGMNAAQSAKVDKWRAQHQPERVRAYLRQSELSPRFKQQIEAGAASIVSQVLAKKADPCGAAVAITQTSEAQFTRSAPELLAEGEAAGAAAEPEAHTKGAAQGRDAAPKAAAEDSAQSAVGDRAAIQALLSTIDSFAFATRAGMGVGGMITLQVYPVVLMRSGEALKNVEGLMFPGGLDAHRRANPDDWTRWRRSGSKLEWQTKKGWEPMSFQKTFSSLPEGFRLDGLFRHLSGSGTAAIGGTQSVAAFNQYQFFRDGKVVRGGGAGATSSTSAGAADGGGTSVATRSTAANRIGRYRIDRLVLDIRYDDGSSEQRILIADPNDPKTAIWLDGVGYTRKKN